MGCLNGVDLGVAGISGVDIEGVEVAVVLLTSFTPNPLMVADMGDADCAIMRYLYLPMSSDVRDVNDAAVVVESRALVLVDSKRSRL